MPWEFIAEYVATKTLDKTLKTVLFSEKIRSRLNRTGIAERYLTLSAEQLLTFYHEVVPLDVEVAGRRYVLPISVVMESSVKGGEKISCETMSGAFTVPERLIAYTKPVKGVLAKDKNSFDGRVTRLAAYDGDKIILQEASYYEGVATNFSADHRPKDRKESLREMLHAKLGSFGDFKNNPFVNHIGVVCIVETSDGMLIVQKRSRNVTNRGGSLSSSVSGAVNWTDIRSKSSPFSIRALAEPTFREAIEELGVSVNEIVFLGLMREFLRGGKPEAYFYAKTEEPFERVHAKWRHAEGRKESSDIVGYEFHSDRVGADELSRDRFKVRVRQLLDKVGDTANLTLTAGVALTTRHVLESTP